LWLPEEMSWFGQMVADQHVEFGDGVSAKALEALGPNPRVVVCGVETGDVELTRVGPLFVHAFVETGAEDDVGVLMDRGLDERRGGSFTIDNSLEKN